MFLPAKLSQTTLGDVLATLYRQGITGTLELVDAQGRRHAIGVHSGCVTDVATPLVPGGARDQLEALFTLGEASIRFHVARRRVDGPPLSPLDVLSGRPRARDKRASPPVRHPDVRARALAAFGLPPSAAEGDVRRAFRRIARDIHPDRCTLGTTHEQQERAERFAELSAAYHALVA